MVSNECLSSAHNSAVNGAKISLVDNISFGWKRHVCCNEYTWCFHEPKFGLYQDCGIHCVFLQSVILDGFQIPKGYAVAYLSWNANMDPTVFKDPEKFLPERWEAR